MSSTISPTTHRAPGPPDYWLLRRLRKVARDPVGTYSNAWKTYGDIVRFHWYGPFNAYMVVAPELVERVLQANWSNYARGFFYKRVAVFTGKGLFTSEGDLWLRQRRLAQPAFHRQKIADLSSAMSFSVKEMMDDWDRQPDHHAVNIADEMMCLTLRVALRALFGAELSREETEKLHQLINVGMAQIDHRFNPVTLPENVPTKRNRRFLRAKQDLEHWILNLAENRRRTGERPGDLLSMLIDAVDEEGHGMDDRQLLDEVITLLASGHESSAVALSWGWSLLAQNPEIQEKLYEEANRVLGGRVPTYEDCANLPYALMVFKEAMRLYPPIWAIPREASGDDELGGFPIAARSTVLVVPYLTHRHPDHWENPNQFDPERFTPERSEGRHKFAYVPFGAGPRLCIGQGFAMLEGQIILAMLANRYRFELAPGEHPKLHPTLTLRPRGGIKMIRHRR